MVSPTRFITDFQMKLEIFHLKLRPLVRNDKILELSKFHLKYLQLLSVIFSILYENLNLN